MLLVGVQERYAEDGAVGGNQRQVYAEQAVQYRAGLGDEHFGEADKHGDGDDEADGAQVAQAEGFEEVGVEQVGADGGEGEDEGGGKPHAERGVDFARDAHERAESEKLREDEVIDQDGREDDVEIAVLHGVWRMAAGLVDGGIVRDWRHLCG